MFSTEVMAAYGGQAQRSSLLLLFARLCPDVQ
jgi:hypothetical protein